MNICVLILLVFLVLLLLFIINIFCNKEKLDLEVGFPKVIYMCHKRLKDITIYSKNWKKLNPKYNIKLYDDTRCKTFLLENFSKKHTDIFLYLKDGPIKADFWRVCILYKKGGIYIDSDIEPLVPLDDYIVKDIDFATCIIQLNKYNPHFIIAKPYNKILKKCIDKYIEKYDNNEAYEYWKWSIVPIFNEIMKQYNLDKEGIYYKDNMKIQLLSNIYKDSYRTEHVKYKTIRVFNNRYRNYIKHNFKN